MDNIAGAEAARLAAAETSTDPWRAWGPYVAERAWGTVREDYSADGDAWTYFPHDDARSRTYRWNEDGMAAICDEAQTWCLGLALWNGVDPIIKERMFGLSGPEGNHGEDAKEYWWYLDSTPTHSWMTWRYHYPQRAFPYDELVTVNGERGRDQGEYELLDTGIFAEDSYFVVTVDYAKATPHEMLMRITIENAAAIEASIEVLPTLWFRNTWAWDVPAPHDIPTIQVSEDHLVARYGHDVLSLAFDGEPESLFCDNETNTERLYGVAGRSAFPKDGINDHVVTGAATVNPAGVGTKAALRYRLTIPAGDSREIRLRLKAGERAATDLTADFAGVMSTRHDEADAYFAALTPDSATADEALVLRQAVAGLMWGKQFYHYDVARWLDGDPTEPTPPASRQGGRNAGWRHLDNHDVISMPDAWEYPWYASWDLAFHCVTLAHVDPEFAKAQLLLMLREWYQHPNGQIPGYEWSFGDVNPPVQAWAALRVFDIAGGEDYTFLARACHKLLLDFTWWVNRKDASGKNVFEGGFLGLDNIGPLDRSAALPIDALLEQSDGTAWMAMYALNLLEIALVLAEQDDAYEDLATKFFEHFAYIAEAMRDVGLWDADDGFFYDVLRFADGSQRPLQVRSVVGLVPLCATTTLGSRTLERLPSFAARFEWFIANRPRYQRVVGATHVRDGNLGRLLSIVDRDALVQILTTMLSTAEFLSPHGIRSLSRRHADHPFTLDLAGASYTVGYEPAESRSGAFGGNSNWRGPVWFPINYLVIEALRRFGRFYGDDLTVEHPTGAGNQLKLDAVADDLAGRLISIFLADEAGQRPVFGTDDRRQTDPRWHDLIPFHEYFDGDTGRGLGASHQTGWTALVADLILRRRP